MVAVIVGASLLGYFNAARQTPQYSSTATLLYGRPLNMQDPLSSGSGYVDPTQQQLDVEGVGTVIEGPDIIQRVTTAVGAAAMASTTVTATAVMPSDARNYTNTAIITAVSANPQQSATVANAYAAAFVADRRDQQKVQVQQAEAVMRGEANRTPHGSDDYILLEGRLRDLQILEATLTGDFRLVKPATPASHPFAPKPFRAAILGAGIGIFAAVGVAFLLEQLNTRIRDYRETAEILRLPVIGRIPALPKKYSGDHSVTVIDFPESRTAEAFRMLRGNLDFVCVDDETHALLVTSCWQGEGKSMTIANLAVALALAGKRVVLIDGDLRRPQMHKYFDLANESGLSAVLGGRETVDQAMQPVDLWKAASTGGNGSGPVESDQMQKGELSILTSGPEPPNPGEMIASKRFASLMDELKLHHDFVLVDSPAIMAVGDAAALAQGVDGVIVLVDISTTRRPALREVREILDPMPCRKLGIIVVREKIPSAKPYRYSYYKYHT